MKVSAALAEIYLEAHSFSFSLALSHAISDVDDEGELSVATWLASGPLTRSRRRKKRLVRDERRKTFGGLLPGNNSATEATDGTTSKSNATVLRGKYWPARLNTDVVVEVACEV